MGRQACSLRAGECVRSITAAANSQHIDKWALAIKVGPTDAPSEALEYSLQSTLETRLVEVDIDDFVATMREWNRQTSSDANALLGDVIGNLKSRNTALKFGITLYEDDLGSNIVTALNETTRARVDRVVFYLHYRRNIANYETYLRATRALFPNAAIWAGSYAYDRIDYLPCQQGVPVACSSADELALFNVTIITQIRLMRANEIAGIEFYPGYFGIEDQWIGWKNRRICKADRIWQCVFLTRQMRQSALKALQAKETGH